MVEMMYDKNDMRLLGFTFYNKHGATLLATAWASDDRYQNKESFNHIGIKNIPLGDTEKLLGIRSDTRGKKIATHYEFSFIIGRDPTEEEMKPPEKKPNKCLTSIKKYLND